MPLDGSEFKFEISETTKLLIAARERIERGWCQNKMRLRGEVCMVGAMRSDNDTPQECDQAWDRIARAIGLREVDFRHSLAPIVLWNDTKGRTKEDVLRAYDRAIAASLSGSAYP